MCCGTWNSIWLQCEEFPAGFICLIRSISWSVKMCCGINETVFSFNEKSSRQDLSACSGLFLGVSRCVVV